jgi:hypothetical protein
MNRDAGNMWFVDSFGRMSLASLLEDTDEGAMASRGQSTLRRKTGA